MIKAEDIKFQTVGDVLDTFSELGKTVGANLQLLPLVESIEFTRGMMVFNLTNSELHLPTVLDIWEAIGGRAFVYSNFSDSAYFGKIGDGYAVKICVNGKQSPLFKRLFGEAVESTVEFFHTNEDEVKASPSFCEKKADF